MYKPQFQKRWDAGKHSWEIEIKTECKDLQILFDLYSVEYSTKTRELRFKLLRVKHFTGEQVKWLQVTVS